MGATSIKQSKDTKRQTSRRVITMKHADKLFVAIAALLCIEVGLFSRLYTNLVPPHYQRQASASDSNQDYSSARLLYNEKAADEALQVTSEAISIRARHTEEIRPRAVLLETTQESHYTLSRSSRTVEPMGNLDCCNKDPLHYIKADERPFHEDCSPMADWQTKFFPTCNIMHELPLVESGDKESVNNVTTATAFEPPVTLINTQGSWRMVWKVTQRYQKESEPQQIVLKTLRYNREFDLESFQLQYVDSMAMERLTSSPYIANEYGFCGQSVLTEFATNSGRDLIKNKKLKTWQRVQIAHDLAASLADMHSIDYPNATNATFTHNDINIANTIQGEHGRIKFNDFNIGVLMRWNRTKPCGYPVHFSAPLWRSPEEISATNTSAYVHPEKSDTYALGNLLFQVLTTHQPWTWLEPDGRLSVEEVIRKKLDGDLPFIPTKFHGGNKTGTRAIYYATIACYEHDPENRPTSFQLAQALRIAMDWTKRGVSKNVEEVKHLFDFRKKKRNQISAAKEAKVEHASRKGSTHQQNGNQLGRSVFPLQRHASNKTKELVQAKKNQVQEAERNKGVIVQRQASRPKSNTRPSLRLPEKEKRVGLVEKALGRNHTKATKRNKHDNAY